MDVNYFAAVSDCTELGERHQMLVNATDDLPELCQLVQGNLIHSYWLQHYGVDIDQEQRFTEMQLRTADDILSAANVKSGTCVDVIKPPHRRVVSVCRDFSLVLCAILRAKGIPARIRSGFARYLTAEKFEDHWVCEYWDKNCQRWKMADAQLDDIHHHILKYEFDPCDVPSDQFLVAGKAWKLCRSGKEDPEKFGFDQFSGLEFIKGSLIRDIFALAKYEMHTWDVGWGILPQYLSPIAGEDEFGFLDELGQISVHLNVEAAIEITQTHELVKLPEHWNYASFPTLQALFEKNVPERV